MILHVPGKCGRMSERKPVTVVEFIKYLQTLPVETKIMIQVTELDGSGCYCDTEYLPIDLAPNKWKGSHKLSNGSCEFTEFQGPYLEIGE